MSKEKLNNLIDKVIGKVGPLRVPAYWIGKLLKDIVEWAEKDINRLRGSIPTKVGQLKNDAGFVSTKTLEASVANALSDAKAYTNNSVASRVTTSQLDTAINKAYTTPIKREVLGYDNLVMLEYNKALLIASYCYENVRFNYNQPLGDMRSNEFRLSFIATLAPGVRVIPTSNSPCVSWHNGVEPVGDGNTYKIELFCWDRNVPYFAGIYHKFYENWYDCVYETTEENQTIILFNPDLINKIKYILIDGKQINIKAEYKAALPGRYEFRIYVHTTAIPNHDDIFDKSDVVEIKCSSNAALIPGTLGHCYKLKKVELNEYITDFSTIKPPSLAEIHIDSLSHWLTIESNNYGPPALIYINGAPIDSDMVIPEDVYEIKGQAMREYPLTSIRLPSHPVHFGTNFFYDYKFTKIYAPSVEVLLSSTKAMNGYFTLLYDDTSIYIGESEELSTTIEVPINVTKIGNLLAGWRCESIILHDRVTELYAYCFSGLSIKSISIPQSITEIPSGAFRYCHSLEEVSIPDSVHTIGSGAFDQCSSLPVVDGVRYADTALVQAVSLSTTTSLIVKDGTRFICNGAFSKQKYIENIVFPSTITKIGSSAFNGCTSMLSYDFSNSATVPTLEYRSAFTGIPATCKIIVPDQLYDEWISWTNWSAYADYIIKKSDWDAQQTE